MGWLPGILLGAVGYLIRWMFTGSLDMRWKLMCTSTAHNVFDKQARKGASETLVFSAAAPVQTGLTSPCVY